MSKSKLTLKIDEEIKENAKRKFNVSQTVEDHLRDLVATPEKKEDRIEEINEEIKEHKDEISEHQRKISNLQSELNLLEKQLKEEAQVKNEKVKFFRIFKRNEGDSWKKPSDIPEYWRAKFDETVNELWKLGQNSDAEPAKTKKKTESTRTPVNN